MFSNKNYGWQCYTLIEIDNFCSLSVLIFLSSENQRTGKTHLVTGNENKLNVITFIELKCTCMTLAQKLKKMLYY